MRMKSPASWAALGLGAMTAYFLLIGVSGRSAPAVKVGQVSKTIVAADHNPIQTTFEVANSGGGDLLLGEVSTTCGCTVASITKKIIEPGGHATIVVDVTPPDTGERVVDILIQTNAGPEPLKFSVTAVSRKAPPFVVSSPGSIRIHIDGDDHVSESFRVLTRERINPPWIARVSSSSGSFAVSGGMEKERDAGTGVLYREYSYTIQSVSIPGFGDHCEKIELFPKESTIPLLQIPLIARVEPPVVVTPKSLYASLDKADADLNFVVAVRSSSAHEPPKVTKIHSEPNFLVVSASS